MQFTVNTAGIDALRQRIAEARAQLPGLIEQAVMDAGEIVAGDFSQAAPKGKNSGGTPLPGDAPGPLSESFSVRQESPPSSTGAAISVITSQPAKLSLVTNGRGEVLPRSKQALFWQGLDHPVRRAGPVAPNPFVDTVLSDVPDAQEVLGGVVSDIIMILEGA